jgi:ribosomal protein S14
MAWYEVKKKVRVLNEYQCESCGQESSMEQVFYLKATGKTKEMAYHNLEQQINQILRGSSTNTKYKRCGNCGYVQSWMISNLMLARVMLWTIILLGLGVFLFLVVVPYNLRNAGWCIIPAVLAIACFVIIKLYKPNRKFPAPTTINKPRISLKPD